VEGVFIDAITFPATDGYVLAPVVF